MSEGMKAMTRTDRQKRTRGTEAPVSSGKYNICEREVSTNMGGRIFRGDGHKKYRPKALTTVALLIAALISLFVLSIGPAWSADDSLVHNSNRFGICKDSGGTEIP